MSAPEWRGWLITGWLALTLLTFLVIDNGELRSWLLLLVFGFIPPAMLTWLWNEDRPLPMESLRPTGTQPRGRPFGPRS